MRMLKLQGKLLAAAIAMVTILPRIAVAAEPNPSPAERQNFHEKMLAIPHSEGCFVARYADPKPHWQKEKCGKPPKSPNPDVERA